MTAPELRRLVKTGLAVGAHWSRLDRVIAARRGLDRAPLVLGYHRVVRDFERSARDSMPSMLVSTTMLERHLNWVGDRYRFVSLDELAERLADGGRRGRAVSHGDKPLAAVTFDDGYRDVYENAFPLLRKKRIPFAVYVVTDLVGTDRLQLHDELYLLLAAVLALDPSARSDCWRSLVEEVGGDPQRAALFRRVDESGDAYRATRLVLHGLGAEELGRAMAMLRTRVPLNLDQCRAFLSLDWPMLREMLAAGVTVGSHTRSHALLASAPTDRVREELEGSRRELETQLGVPVRHLAYPDGSYNAETVRAAHAAGYRTATTTGVHQSRDFPGLTIPRRMLWEGACNDVRGRFSPAILSCQVSGLFDSVADHEH